MQLFYLAKLIFLFIVFVLLQYTPATAHTIHTTNNLVTKQPIGFFQCREKIYAYTAWSDMSEGNHTIEAYWYNPQGTLQEHTTVNFTYPTEASWAWIKLKGNRGAKLFKAFNPQIGYEDFIGPWRVEMYLDGKYLETKYFQIYC